jgi:hypothetical protein
VAENNGKPETRGKQRRDCSQHSGNCSQLARTVNMSVQSVCRYSQYASTFSMAADSNARTRTVSIIVYSM